jgi:predicted nucleotidyltransferase
MIECSVSKSLHSLAGALPQVTEEVVNLLFEKRMSNLVSLLHKITRVLTVHRVPYELIGGLAVMVYIEEASPEHTPLTRDVDLMIDRSDLERTIKAAEEQGFRYRHAAGVDMLLPEAAQKAIHAVHLLFSGEKVSPNQAVPNPPIRPRNKSVEGGQVMVIPIEDLIIMKLSSFRLKDQVHIKAFDAASLILPSLEKRLNSQLAERLRYIRNID